MKPIHIAEMRNNSILRIYTQKQHIQTDPEYQRMGEIWTLEKRQLLIDSIINDFDIPKIYFHEFPEVKKLADGKVVKYAIIDGRQRLESIWAFIDNEFALSDDFEYYEDPSVKAQSMTYKEIAEKYPNLKSIFDSFSLPIMSVITSDVDLIEEMFSRLNEAVPLNSAEKRNAFGGPLPSAIRNIEGHKFFKKCIPIRNTRYQHREISCKVLFLTYEDKIKDTKKVYLDAFVKDFKHKKMDKEAKVLADKAIGVLSTLAGIFIKKDPLLRSQSMIVIYYLAAKDATENNWINKFSRKKLLAFEQERQQNRVLAEKEISKASYELLEFDKMALQGTNDGPGIQYRYDVLIKYLKQ